MHRSIFVLLLILLLMHPGCNQDNSPSPLKFKGYENNPVLVPGKPGSWDDLFVLSAFVLKHDGLIYLFYTAYSRNGKRSLGLATSPDGYHFTRFEGNPILEGDGRGYDAFGVAQASVVKQDSGWVLYFNAREIAGFSSGPSIGRATAKSLTGPWTKSEDPVLTTGHKGEWDSDFTYLGPVLQLNDTGYIMYYAGGDDLVSQHNFFIGMATSKDGMTWKKHNDPATTQHPFAESDPVLMTGNLGDWDDGSLLTGMVLKCPGGFEMYYAGAKIVEISGEEKQIESIGFATSEDGIHWKKYRHNPVYRLEDDPYSKTFDKAVTTIQGPKFLFQDSLCFMYYDYGHLVGKIGLAVAEVKVGK